MLRVLLIKSRSMQSKVTSFTPPLGVLYLAAHLRKHLGAEVRVADVLHMKNPAQEIAGAVRHLQPDLVGLSGLTCEDFMLHQAAQIVRSVLPGVPLVAGGPYASSDPARLLSDRNIDAAVIGEGEETLLELVRCVQEEGPAWKSSLAAIAGVASRGENGAVRHSPPRPPISDLDSLPPPAWDAIDVRWFWARRSMSTAGVRPYMPIFTSRGCPYSCTYCHNLFGRKFRARSPESVVEEMAELQQVFGVNDFEFLDDSINLDRQRFAAILTGLLDRGLHPMLHFPNGVRTDHLTEEEIRLIHQVGAGEISVAVETASPRLQKRTKKNLDLEKVRRNIELMAKLRIFTRGFFMLGYPTETEEELRATIEYAAASRLHLATFFIANPFPGTAMFDEFKSLGKLPEDLDSVDYEYVGTSFNASEVSDARFRTLFRQAYARFYFQPKRIARILRDRPYLSGYGLNLYSLVRVVGFSRLQEFLRSLHLSA